MDGYWSMWYFIRVSYFVCDCYRWDEFEGGRLVWFWDVERNYDRI